MQFIESLLTCKIDRSAFDAQFAECERLKNILRAQKGQMQALRHQLSSMPPADDPMELVAIAQKSHNLGEWIQMVSLWLRVLQSLTGLLSHMARSSANGPLEDAVEALRETIERDLFIPTTTTSETPSTAAANGNMEQ